MGNSSALSIAVLSGVSDALAASTNVQNLGPEFRTFVYVGASANDICELWGSVDGTNFGQVERDLNGQKVPVVFSGTLDHVVINDRSLVYATKRRAGAGSAALSVASEDVGSQVNALTSAFKARNVGPFANVANLSAFAVAGNDGITNVAGDVVLLIAQTTPSQNGPWVVGAVSAGAAPVTRPAWWPAGGTIPAGQRIEVAAGTVYAGTSWKAMTTAAFAVDTGDPQLFPVFVAQDINLGAGTANITNVPLRGGTKTHVSVARITPNTTANTIAYNPTTITAGVPPTATLTVQAQVAAGTINNADLSLLRVGVHQG